MGSSTMKKLFLTALISVFCMCLLMLAPVATAAEITASTPGITSVAPDLAWNGETELDLTITGYQFQGTEPPGPQPEVLLTKAGEDPIPCYDVVVNWEGTEIDCKVWVYAIAGGDWNVVVTNPDGGSCTKTAAVTILDPSYQTVHSGSFGLVRSMEVFNGYLYAGANGSGSGAHLWRTTNGTDWSAVITNGFGNSNNITIISMAVFGGYIYAGTINSTNGCEVWRSSDGIHFYSTTLNGFGDAANKWASSMAVFNGYLYVGTGNDGGCEVWRTSNGTSWDLVSDDGFGDKFNNRRIDSMLVFKNRLYAGTNTYRYMWEHGCDIFRTSTGTSWSKVSSSGFGNISNVGVPSMEEFEGQLYVGTYDIVVTPQCDLWRAPDGIAWECVESYGFYSVTGYPNGEISDMCVVGDLACMITRGGLSFPDHIIVSKDGDTWMKLSSSLYWNPYKLCTFNGQLYIGGDSRIDRLVGLLRPKVTSIIPSSGFNTGSVNVTIRGSDFQSGATAKLTLAGQNDINGSNVNVVNSSTITCAFNIKGAAGGNWNVVVTNPDGAEGSLPAGFKVTPCGTGGGMAVLALGLFLGLVSAGETMRRRRKRTR